MASGLTYSDDPKILQCLEKSLSEIALVFEAHRVFIFLTDQGDQTFSPVMEWHDKGLHSLQKKMSGLRLRDYILLSRYATSNDNLYIGNTSNIPDSYPLESKLFRTLSTQSFLQKPFTVAGKTKGFLAIMKSEEKLDLNAENKHFLDVAGELLAALLAKTHQPATKEPLQQEATTLERATAKAEKDALTDPRLYEKVFENLDYGIALFDTEKQDFVFVNNRYAKLFGFPGRKNFRAGEALHHFVRNGYNLSDFFSIEKRKIIKDFSLTIHDQHINGSISPVSNTQWVALSAYDITPMALYEQTEKNFHRQMKIISEAAIELISSEKKPDIYQFLGETTYSILKDAVVTVNQYNPCENNLQTVFVKGLGYPLDAITKFLGQHPLHKKYPLDITSDTYEKIVSSRVHEVKGGLTELTMGAVAEPIARKLEQLIGTTRYFSCGIFAANKLYGTLTLLLKEEAIVNTYVLEAFVRMTSNALHAKDIREKLYRTSRFLSDAVEIARIGYWQYDFCNQQVLVSKRLYKKLMDKDSVANDENYLSMNDLLTRFVDDQDARAIKRKLKKAYQNKNNPDFSVELEWKLRKNGDLRDIYTKGVINQNGNLMGVAQDITGLRKAEKDLRESESKFQNLVEQSMDAIVIIQDNGIITEWNPMAEDLSGLPAEEVVGKYAWEVESDIIFQPDTPKQQSYSTEKLKKRFFTFFNASSKSIPFTSEVSIQSKTEEVRHLTITSFRFRAGNSSFLCRIGKDITLEKKKRERKKQQEIINQTAKAKDLFLDNMSHEMRTPLGGIIGMTDILMHSNLEKRQHEMVGIIKESSDSLLELISNIHELSRIEADGIIIQSKNFRPGELLAKSANTFKASALQKNVQLQIINQTPEDLVLLGDEFRLTQVLTNLIANAIKFTPCSGRVEVEASASEKDHQHVELTLKVSDTGIGIPKEKLPFLFEKFTQADNSYTREHDGAGIGLTISKEITELMGGEIGVSSKKGRGSVFWVKVTLPLAEK